MELFTIVCLLVALILFLLAGFNVPSPKWNLIAFGLAALTLALLGPAIEAFK